jgi:hypothetical protein
MRLLGIRLSPLLAGIGGVAVAAVGYAEGRLPVIAVGVVVVVVAAVRHLATG